MKIGMRMEKKRKQNELLSDMGTVLEKRASKWGEQQRSDHREGGLFYLL